MSQRTDLVMDEYPLLDDNLTGLLPISNKKKKAANVSNTSTSIRATPATPTIPTPAVESMPAFTLEFNITSGQALRLEFKTPREAISVKALKEMLRRKNDALKNARLIAPPTILRDEDQFVLDANGDMNILFHHNNQEIKCPDRINVIPEIRQLIFTTRSHERFHVSIFATQTMGDLKRSIANNLKKLSHSDILFDGGWKFKLPEPIAALPVSTRIAAAPELFEQSEILIQPDFPTNKAEFLIWLQEKLAATTLNTEVLDLFTLIKDRNGPCAFIHEQRHAAWDSFRFFFCKQRNGEDFWHTATYQTAVKMLKEAYVALPQAPEPPEVDENAENIDFEQFEARANYVARKAEGDALIDYVRGNAPRHKEITSTRAGLQ